MTVADVNVCLKSEKRLVMVRTRGIDQVSLHVILRVQPPGCANILSRMTFGKAATIKKKSGL